jgi:hypothetical protein
VSAELGENLTLTVFYYYLGTLPLTFVWYKDGLPLSVVTPVGPIVSLNIPGVALDDAGNYELGITPASCAQVLSSIIHVDVVCVQDIGLPAPKFTYGIPSPLNPAGYDGFDWTSIASRGTLEVQATVDCAGGADGWNYYSFGSFAYGRFFAATYNGGAYHWTATRTNVDPACDCVVTPCGTPVGVPNSIFNSNGRFLMEDAGTMLIKGTWGPKIAKPTCAEIDAQFGALPVQITGGDWQMHLGGQIQGAASAFHQNAATCACGTTVITSECPMTLELFEYALESPFPDNVRLKDFDDIKTRLTMCPTCEARNLTEWDGTFPLASRGRQPDYFRWVPIIDPALISLNGKRLSTVYTRIDLVELLDGTPIWLLLITCLNLGDLDGGAGECIWSGYKDVGRDPTGIYMWDPLAGFSGTACTPQEDLPCIEIESY